MAFLRVVEVLPPMFPDTRDRNDYLHLDEKVDRFLAETKGIRDLVDVFLVANVKDPSKIKISTIEAAAMLQELLRVEAAPVIVVRDQNRQQFASSVLTCVGLDLKSIMIAWGDDYPESAKTSNVRDFPSLSKAIAEATLIKERARAPLRIFAPVDVDRLGGPKGGALAKERLRAGADLLLAQPPTTDDGGAFERHTALLDRSGVKGKTLLNVFPFKDEADIGRYEKLFNWKLPNELRAAASKGEPTLVDLERRVIERLRREGHPGVYLSTRGSPALAEKLLS